MNTITKEKLSQAAQAALDNWDHQLMVPGQSTVLQSIVDCPHNFADNDGKVNIPVGWDIWKYLEEVSSSLA